MSDGAILEHLLTLLEDYKDFNSSLVETQSIPCAVDFAKQVSKGYPCVYDALERHTDGYVQAMPRLDPSSVSFPATSWSKQDLTRLLGDTKLEVAVTPDGRADDIKRIDGTDEPVFLSPASIDMTIAELLTKLDDELTGGEQSKPVYYLQSQNSNLTTTNLQCLLREVPQNLSFAEPVLGKPEAINIWIGGDRSVTSTHRDPYENLYFVLKGSKTFTLYPPVDELTLPTKNVLTGKYTFDAETERFDVEFDKVEDSVDSQTQIPWVDIGSSESRSDIIRRHSIFQHSSPRVMTVKEGQILYLPSGWYHMVQQRCGIWDDDGSRAPCIAVNYWYDMEYGGEKYAMRQLISRLASDLRRTEAVN